MLYFFGLKDYQKERIETWLNMLYEKPVDEQGAAWVPKHNMIAIGSAGYIGKANPKKKFSTPNSELIQLKKNSNLVTENKSSLPNDNLNQENSDLDDEIPF